MSITPKILRLIVHETGAISTYGTTGEELGYHLESGVTEIRFFIPNTCVGLHHHIYVKQPDGTILVSPVLEEHNDDSILSGKYVKVSVGDPITSQVGRVKLEYVGNDATENQVFLSATKNMDIDESVYGEYCASENGSWDSEWQKDIDDLEQRVVEAESQAAGAVETAAEAKGIAQTAEGKADEARSTAAGAVSTAEGAVSTANSAVSTANAASSAANSAVSTANSASSTAAGAVTTANEAKSIAQGIDGKATQALSDSASAVSTANSASSAANSAVSTANGAASTAGSAVTTANAASATAGEAKSIAQATASEVEEFFHTKLGIVGPYTELPACKVGGKLTLTVKNKPTSNYLIEYFHGKNLIDWANLTIGGDSAHPADAFSPLIPVYEEYLYLTIPSGWRVYVKEINALAYKGDGTVIAEHHFEESGAIALAASTLGKSIRIYVCKLIDGTEVIPTSSELAALATQAQLEYGAQATEHESYLAPRIITPVSYAVDGVHEITFDSHYGSLAIVPTTGTSDDSLPYFASSVSDLTKTKAVYETGDVAQQAVLNTIKNENQDAQLIDHEARIKALEQTSGNEVFGTQFTGLSTVGVRLLSAAGKEFDLSQGVNDFQSVMPFLNIQEVDELSYDSSGNEILDGNGNHLVNKMIYFPDLYLQLTTITNAGGDTVQTLYVSTVARSGYTKIPHFLYGKYAGAWRTTSDSDWIGSFSGHEPVANYAWTSANSKMVYVKDPALGLDEPTRLWPVPDARAYSAVAFLLFTLLGGRNAQAVFRGICDESLINESTVRSYGNTGSSSNAIILPSSHAIAALAVGGKFTIYANGNRWLTKTITAKEADTPSSGYTTLTFDGNAVNWSTGTIRVGLHAGELTGATDSVAGDFATLGQDGLHAFKVFGIENLYGNLWNPLASVVIKQTFDGTVGHNELCVRDWSTTFSNSGYDSYPATGLEVPNVSSNYVKEVGFAEGVLISTVLGGGASSSAAWCDYTYTNTRTSAGTSYKQVMVGGNYCDGSFDGPVYFGLYVGWGSASCGIGLRPFLPLP